MSQTVVTPFKHHTVASRRGNVRWDLNIPVGAKGLIKIFVRNLNFKPFIKTFGIFMA